MESRTSRLPGVVAPPATSPTQPSAGPDPGHTASTHLSEALTRLVRMSERFEDPALADEARTALQPLEENLLRMVALGQFKRGKSTLVNALLGVPLLPVGVAPVTSVATIVRWAPEPHLVVHHDDGTAQDATLDRLKDFVVEARNPGNALGVRLVEVGYPASLLEDGLVLVDTPGIGSTDRSATERAYGFLPSVDAGLVVLSPDPPVGEAEAAYLRELAALTPHLLFVLNKIDRHPESEWREALSFNRQVLAEVLERAPEDVEILPVSARRALDHDDGSMDLVRNRIEGYIARKGTSIREDLAERRLGVVGAKLRALLDMERRALDLSEQDLDERIRGLRSTLQALERRAERTTAAVTAGVDRIVAEAGEELLLEMRSRAGALADGLRRALADTPGQESNLALAGRFDGLLRDGMIEELDGWWQRRGSSITATLLDEMTRAAGELADARREASEWIRETFSVRVPEEPRVEALKESRSFYRSVEGVTPRITVDLLRAALPRSAFRGWLRRRVDALSLQALEMGAGQVRGDLLYRARETARAFTSDLRSRTLAGMHGLEEGLRRAASLRLETGRVADARRQELDEGAAELDLLLGGDQ